MSDAERRVAAGEFAEQWKDRGYEKGEAQPFWRTLLAKVCQVRDLDHFIIFEKPIRLGKLRGFIDGLIPSTHVLIEQKGRGKELDAPEKQSDGSMLTPFEQAKRYADALPYSERPRWIVTCNFREFHIHDMNAPQEAPHVLKLEDLPGQHYRLSFLTDAENPHVEEQEKVSVAAGGIVSRLYDALLKQYRDPSDPATLKSLNILCVRLVFCMYAEDTGLLGERDMFCDYLAQFPAGQTRRALLDLFAVLNTPLEERGPYLEPSLAAFPYVNGGLFAEENIEIPLFTEEIRELLIERSSRDFDWSDISPTIFGALFESTLNPETRRSGGMHYTSIENIHKVIDPLFLDDLTEELERACAIKVKKTRESALRELQKRMASLSFLDPAAGSGNFLTETYICLRRLENRIIRELYDEKWHWLEGTRPVKLSIGQFYGIEINDFAVSVAQTALWIAESQMLRETENIVGRELDFLPLKTSAHIVEGNALRLDWGDVAPKDKLSYIMGNPPFVGYTYQSADQKKDVQDIYADELGKPYKMAGKMDYVSCWYFKAAQFMQGTAVRAAFVSTNSITQGEQTAAVWKPLYERFGTRIDFAHRSFIWDSEANQKAHVHCVIIGFSCGDGAPVEKRIFSDGQSTAAKNINPYLVDAPTVFLEKRTTPLCPVPQMITGNRPADGGNLIIEAVDYDEFIQKEPKAQAYIKRLIGSEEFINGKKRWCLWLVGVSPAELRSMPNVMKRVEACRQARLGGAPDRQKLADSPHLFRETNNPETYVVVPSVSSERRPYVPMGFLTADTIPTNLVLIIPNATLYHFGVLTSSAHMAWMRAVAGRLKSDYRYSKDIVYNNFPWPEADEKQRAEIAKTAQGILDARALYPDSSLADLYDTAAMPPELRAAHRANDAAVLKAYGFARDLPEAEIVARLMEKYVTLTAVGTASGDHIGSPLQDRR